MVSIGFAVGLGQVEQLNPVFGVHTYVAAPPAFNTVLPPKQIAGEPGVIDTGKTEATETTSVKGVAGQPSELPVIVYVVVDNGVALTIAPVEALKVAEGVHVYVAAPDAVRFTFPPGQIVGVNGATDIVGVGFTVTTTDAGITLLQPVDVPTTVYVVVMPGDTLMVEPVKAPGDHV